MSKKLSRLLRRITSKNDGDYHCIDLLHPFKTKNKLKPHKSVCKNHNYCYLKIPKKIDNMLKYTQGKNL